MILDGFGSFDGETNARERAHRSSDRTELGPLAPGLFRLQRGLGQHLVGLGISSPLSEVAGEGVRGAPGEQESTVAMRERHRAPESFFGLVAGGSVLGEDLGAEAVELRFARPVIVPLR